jgi:hypothetical protein
VRSYSAVYVHVEMECTPPNTQVGYHDENPHIMIGCLPLYVQNIVPTLIPSYGPSYPRLSNVIYAEDVQTHMVKDVTHENIWNCLDLALTIDSIIISYNGAMR